MTGQTHGSAPTKKPRQKNFSVIHKKSLRGRSLLLIVLSGYYGFDNAGDEALLSAICSSIRRIEPGAEFVVLSGCPQKLKICINFLPLTG